MRHFKSSATLQILLLILISSACSDTIPTECTRFDDWQTITEEEKGITCEYQQIYIYNGEYYSVCVCCLCFKAPVAFDCNGEPICELDEVFDCMKKFNKKAEYQYSAVEP